ncbi:MAG TPA: hypothetical protein VHD60_01015 [Candidatus Saccharimonadales bacterium]|nr:hypothetical protein [Candidatus Saccharimonadales bacterium]
MTIPKKYFHDRAVLILLTVNIFLALLAPIWILLRLSAGHGAYTVQCRDCSNPAVIDRFKSGNVVDLLSFIVFALLTFVAQFALSVRTYHIHRQLAITILALGILLLVLTIVVSNALLVLR